jgi:signal transduction histidine kinase
LDSVFEIFRTAPSAGERAGSGLGLAIVKAAMEARGGTVSVASSLGRGTVFTLRFPLLLGPPTALRDAGSDSTDRDPLDELVDVGS